MGSFRFGAGKWSLLGESVGWPPVAQLLRVPWLPKICRRILLTPPIATHQLASLLESRLCQNGFRRDVALLSTSALSEVLLSPLTTHHPSSLTSLSTTPSSPRPCVPTPVSGSSTRARRLPWGSDSATASRPEFVLVPW